MPLYDYQCRSCGIRFEVSQSFKDEPLKVCPECGGEVYRVIGATGVIFKGSGFYVNDSRSNNSARPTINKNGEAKADSTSTANSEGGEANSKASDVAASTTSSTDAAPSAEKSTKSTSPKE